VKLDQVPNFASLSEEEALKKKHEILFRLFQRQISKCVGRGALQVGTLKTTPTETLSVPKINQTGFLLQGNEE